jgi:hypothetical protein
LHLNPCPSSVITPNRDPRLRHGPAHAHKVNRDSGLREARAYLHAASRQVISQEIAELEAAHQGDAINHQPAADVSAAVLGPPMRTPECRWGTFVRRSCRTAVTHRPVEHGGDEETADVARGKGPPPGALAPAIGVRRDFGRWGKSAAPRPASPMVGFLKIMAENEFRLQRGTGDQGGK